MVKDVWFGVLVLKNLHSSKEDSLEIPLKKQTNQMKTVQRARENARSASAEGNSSESNI